MLPIQAVMSPLLRGIGMARGRTTSLTIRLTPAERQMLLAWQRATTISAGRAQRSRLLLGIRDLAAIRGVFPREKRAEPWGVHLPIGCAVLIGLHVVDRLP